METPKNSQFIYTNELLNAGLDTDQALIYQSLLQYGAQPARRISTQTGIGRSLIYKTIDSLIEMNLVKKIEKEGSVAKFVASHPKHILQLIDIQQKKAETAKTSFSSAMPFLTSQFNLLSGKPSVLFFEGQRGMAEVLDDSLYAKEEICSYGDMESILKHIPDVNAKYVKQREKLDIKKRGIILDSEFNRKILNGYATDVSNFKFIKDDTSKPFQSLANIYDGKVSYLTLDADRMIGVIIEDQHIYELQKYLFEYTWGTAKGFEELV